MGIDRADIRYVIHAATKSLERTSGRPGGRAATAGRPECILYYSGADFKLGEHHRSSEPAVGAAPAALGDVSLLPRRLAAGTPAGGYFGQK